MHFPVKAIALVLHCLKMKVLQGATDQQCAGPGAALQLSGHWHSPQMLQLFLPPSQGCPGLEKIGLEKTIKSPQIQN